MRACLGSPERGPVGRLLLAASGADISIPACINASGDVNIDIYIVEGCSLSTHKARIKPVQDCKAEGVSYVLALCCWAAARYFNYVKGGWGFDPRGRSCPSNQRRGLLGGCRAQLEEPKGYSQSRRQHQRLHRCQQRRQYQ